MGIQKAGLDIHNNTDHWLHADTGYRGAGASCFDVPKELSCTTGSCPGYTNDPTKYTTDAMLTPVCLFTSGDSTGYWFDLMMHYHGIGTFLSGVTVITIVLYFVTSSDSGSLVVDLIAANGREAHVVQRIFWALTEGAVAIVLIKTGGTNALKALRALSIIAGLPFTIIMCYMCTSLWRALGTEFDPQPKLKAWKLPLYGGIFDVVESLITCFRAPLPEGRMSSLFFQGLVAPPLLVFTALRNINTSAVDDVNFGSLLQDVVLTVGSALTFYGFILLHIFVPATDEGGLAGIAWTCYVAFAVIVAYVRHVMRVREGIAGNGVEDFFAALVFYPQVLAQVARQAEEPVQAAVVKEVEPLVVDAAPASNTTDNPTVAKEPTVLDI